MKTIAAPSSGCYKSAACTPSVDLSAIEVSQSLELASDVKISQVKVPDRVGGDNPRRPSRQLVLDTILDLGDLRFCSQQSLRLVARHGGSVKPMSMQTAAAGGSSRPGSWQETFTITRNASPASSEHIAEVFANPGFARFPTDHMALINWSAAQGWHDARVVPYGPFSLDPATSALHYGQEIFEGMKAYKHTDGSIVCFRPEQNAARFARSATRMAMPQLPEELFIGAIEALLSLDAHWVPDGPDASLYLRPFMFATDPFLGVRPSDTYQFCVFAAPAGDYFANGFKPVTVWICDDYVRAAPGGTGEAKCAGNYAASLVAQAQAAEHGCDQVVWLDAIERKYVEEVGAMNLGFVLGSGDDITIVTPKLTGTLLPGITRKSLLDVAVDLGYTVEERQFSVDEWREGSASGLVTEAFGCGTAAVITSVGAVKSSSGSWTIGDGSVGPVTERLRSALLSVQNGAAADAHHWLRKMA